MRRKRRKERPNVTKDGKVASELSGGVGGEGIGKDRPFFTTDGSIGSFTTLHRSL